MSSTPLTPTLPNPTSPAERDNPIQWGEKLWERQLMEGEKSEAYRDYKDIQEPFNPAESQGVQGSGTFAVLNVVENTAEKTVSKLKSAAINTGEVLTYGFDLLKNISGAGEYSPNYQPAETPITEEEQTQEVEFKFTLESNQNLAASRSIVRQQDEEKTQVRILGDLFGASNEELNKFSKKSNVNVKTSNKPYDLWMDRNGFEEQQDEVEQAEEERDLAEVKPEIVADMSAAPEGGMGRGKHKMSMASGGE